MRLEPPESVRALQNAECGTDARILGTGQFVARRRAAQALIRRRCREARVGLAELHQGNRRRRLAAVRGALAVQLATRVGLSLADAARQLGVSTSGIAKAVARAEQAPVH